MMDEQRSSHDQNQAAPRLGRQTIIASAALLCLPTAIPLLFITQTSDPTVIGIFVVTSVVLLLLNLLLLRMILRWVQRMAAQAKEP